MDEVFGPGGLIALHHPNYEYRPGQIEMAENVRDTIAHGGITLIEAGTGTGKTLAYLIPALAAGRRIIVSTATKNLQEQLFYKDIPFLQTIIPRKINAILMKGRSNYVCLFRLKQAEVMPILEGLEEVDLFDEIRRWAAETETGDRAELSDLPEDLSFWPQIDARAEICLGQKCPDYDNCFITRMRQQALESDIIIVNHHLFFADLSLRGGDRGAVLPDYDTVIFDEAHEIEDIAASYFGSSVSNYRIADFIQDAGKLVVTDQDQAVEITKALARLLQRSDGFFTSFRGAEMEEDEIFTAGGPGTRGAASSGKYISKHRGSRQSQGDGRHIIDHSFFAHIDRDGTVTLTAVGEAYKGLSKAIDRVQTSLSVLKDPPSEVENLQRRAESLKFDLEFIVRSEDPEFVYWYEKRNRGVFVYATPIDVSGILHENLFSEIESAILTSATLTAANRFDFIKTRLGIHRGHDLMIESHFDFRNQAVLYLPQRMPDPRSPEFLSASVEEIIKIIEVTKGRAFVLFTNISSMRETYEIIKDRIDYPAFLQGQASKASLLARFRTTEGAVLFATSSFWQGVDVQGEALSCVIITKLPFAVPSDPVVAARQKHIDEEGGNSFYSYSVPAAIITLKQGLGRLIRSNTDRGVLSILDPRIRTKAYGKLFLQSIPQCLVTSDLEVAQSVFEPVK